MGGNIGVRPNSNVVEIPGYGEATTEQITSALQTQSRYGFDNATQTVNTISAGVGAVSSLANIYLGFKNIDLAEEELALKKDQYKTAKEEFARVQRVKSQINLRFG